MSILKALGIRSVVLSFLEVGLFFLVITPLYFSLLATVYALVSGQGSRLDWAVTVLPLAPASLGRWAGILPVWMWALELIGYLLLVTIYWAPGEERVDRAELGGLMIFLGDKVNAAVLNARMGRGALALLPGEVLEPGASDGAEGRPMAIAEAGQPVARALASLPAPLLGEARFSRFFKVALVPEGRAILKVAGVPLLAERSLGRGRVLLFTSTADRAWTNLPVHPAYPILLHEAVTYLTTRSHERPFVVGEPLILPLPARSVQTSVVFRTPGGGELAVQVTDRDGQRAAQYDQAGEPGFYEMRQAEAASPTVVAVNVDARESDVKVLAPDSLSTRLSGLPVRVLSPGEEMVPTIRESRVGRELWRILLVLGLAMLALEAYLAFRFSRQMSAGEAVPSAGGREWMEADRDAA